MQLVALVWGILAMLGAVVAFFPCLGALNWLVIPFAAVGLLISIIAFSGAREGGRGAAQAGIVLNGIATLLGSIRLVLGGGVL